MPDTKSRTRYEFGKASRDNPALRDYMGWAEDIDPYEAVRSLYASKDLDGIKDYLASAKASGWTDLEEDPGVSPLKTGAKAAIDSTLLGLPSWAYRSATGDPLISDEEQKANGLSYGAGSLVGGVGSFLIPGVGAAKLGKLALGAPKAVKWARGLAHIAGTLPEELGVVSTARKAAAGAGLFGTMGGMMNLEEQRRAQDIGARSSIDPGPVALSALGFALGVPTGGAITRRALSKVMPHAGPWAQRAAGAVGGAVKVPLAFSAGSTAYKMAKDPSAPFSSTFAHEADPLAPGIFGWPTNLLLAGVGGARGAYLGNKGAKLAGAVALGKGPVSPSISATVDAASGSSPVQPNVPPVATADIRVQLQGLGLTGPQIDALTPEQAGQFIQIFPKATSLPTGGATAMPPGLVLPNMPQELLQRLLGEVKAVPKWRQLSGAVGSAFGAGTQALRSAMERGKYPEVRIEGTADLPSLASRVTPARPYPNPIRTTARGVDLQTGGTREPGQGWLWSSPSTQQHVPLTNDVQRIWGQTRKITSPQQESLELIGYTHANPTVAWDPGVERIVVFNPLTRQPEVRAAMDIPEAQQIIEEMLAAAVNKKAQRFAPRPPEYEPVPSLLQSGRNMLHELNPTEQDMWSEGGDPSVPSVLAALSRVVKQKKTPRNP